MMNHNSSSAFHPQFNMHQQQYQQQQQQQLPHLKQHSLPHQQMHNMHNNNHNNYSPSGGGSGNSSGQQLPNPASYQSIRQLQLIYNKVIRNVYYQRWSQNHCHLRLYHHTLIIIQNSDQCHLHHHHQII
jgi:hypothetical protein